MSIAKNLLIIGLVVVLVAVCLHRIVDSDTQRYCLYFVAMRTTDALLILDDFLRYFNVNGFQNSLEGVISNRMFDRLNTTGLNVGVRKFDGVEVIIFDVLQHSKKRPAILYIHGGGWVHLNPRFYSGLTADLARRLNTLVISIDYRKAPYHPYPAAFNDVLAAVKYFFQNAITFDVDPGRVALMGDSAGGNLAVAVAHHMAEQKRRYKNAHIPKLLVPLCPSLQIADMQLPSIRDNVNDIGLTKRKVVKYVCNYALGLVPKAEMAECMDLMAANGHLDADTAAVVMDNMDWTRFLRGKGYDNRPKSRFTHTESRVARRLSQLALDPRFSPMSALNDTQLRLLPPMFVFGASLDPLRDDAKLMVARASSVGNVAHYKEIDFYHDPYILSVFGFSQSLDALDQLEAVFKRNAVL